MRHPWQTWFHPFPLPDGEYYTVAEKGDNGSRIEIRFPLTRISYLEKREIEYGASEIGSFPGLVISPILLSENFQILRPGIVGFQR